MKHKNKHPRPPDQPPTSMGAILTAILDDDRPRAKELLKADPGLATCLISEARLYESKIVHWIYAGDTALHLAAAGHRFELVRILLAAGADPNSTKNHRQSGPLHYAADGYINGPEWNAKRQVHRVLRGQFLILTYSSSEGEKGVQFTASIRLTRAARSMLPGGHGSCGSCSGGSRCVGSPRNPRITPTSVP